MDVLFKNLGLIGKEAEAWMRMLELGAQPVSVIAKFVGVPRSSMYVIVERLKRCNIVEEFDRSGIKYVKCISVKELSGILLAKERKIKQAIEELDKRIPELEKMENKLSVTPKVKFYEGKEEVGRMYEEVLKEKEFYAFFNPDVLKALMPIYHESIPKKIIEYGRNAKEILMNSKEAEAYKKRFSSKKHQIRIFPKSIKFYSDIIITDTKIYMVSYDERQISATEITNSALAKTHQVMFEEMWKKY